MKYLKLFENWNPKVNFNTIPNSLIKELERLLISCVLSPIDLEMYITFSGLRKIKDNIYWGDTLKNIITEFVIELNKEKKSGVFLNYLSNKLPDRGDIKDFIYKVNKTSQ